MADRWAVATGNWSSTATWNGGTLPTAADDVFADGFTVTIDQNVTVLSIRTTQRTGGTAGGGFILNAGFNVTANVTAGTTTCLTVNNAGNNTITGNCTGSLTTTNCDCVTKGSAGTLTIIGNCIGGNSYSDGVFHNGGTLNVTGNCIGGSAGNESNGINANSTLTVVGNVTGGTSNQCFGIRHSSNATIVVTGDCNGGATGYHSAGIGSWNGSSGSITVNGNCNASVSSPGILTYSGTVAITVNGNCIANVANAIESSGSNSNITINGNCIASTAAAAVAQSSTTATVTINGNCISATNGRIACYIPRMLIHPSTTLQHAYCVNNSGVPGVERSLYTGGVNLNQPAVTNVRSGTVYGASNEFTGTLIVPSAQFVSLGTPVDSGVGTLQYLTMADLQAALAPNAPVIAERSDDDTKALTFSWPASGASILGFKSLDNGAYSSVSGAISYLRTEGARHYYTLAYNAADRSTQESLIRYRMQDGTYTKYFNLRIMPATNSEVIAIKAKTDNLPADPASSSQITSLLNNAPMEAF